MREERPRGLKPVQSIEVSDRHTRPRVILLFALIAVALIAFGFLLYGLLTEDPGWIEVEASSRELHCGDEFIFSYCLGEGELSPTEEKRALQLKYSAAAVHAYRVFNRHESFEGIGNLHTLNTHVGETVTVDPALYTALEQLERSGTRYHYLGALFVEYETLFFGPEEDPAVRGKDPLTNKEMAAFFGRLADFAKDPEAIKLELQGDNRVCLRVSEAYLTFAEEAGIEVFVDLHRMKNAFVVDYLAAEMIAAGFTDGCLSSYDGYVRNLDGDGTGYSLNLFDLQGTNVYPAAQLEYSSARAIVSLRAFAMGERDAYSFYTVSADRVITPYLDPEDGLCRTATDSLIGYSRNQGCAETLLLLLPQFVREELDVVALTALTDQGLHSVWFDEGRILYTESGLTISSLYADETVKYQKQYVGKISDR